MSYAFFDSVADLSAATFAQFHLYRYAARTPDLAATEPLPALQRTSRYDVSCRQSHAFS
jgi:hypothetical protein